MSYHVEIFHNQTHQNLDEK